MDNERCEICDELLEDDHCVECEESFFDEPDEPTDMYTDEEGNDYYD